MALLKGFAGKISIVVAIAVVGLIGIMATSLWVVEDLNQTVLTCTDRRLPITRLIGEFRVQLNAVNRMMWQLAANPNGADAANQISTIRARIQATDQVIADLTAIGLVKKNQENLEVGKTAWSTLRGNYSRILDDIEHRKSADYSSMLGDTSRVLTGLTPVLVDMGEVMAAANAATRSQAQDTVRLVRWVIILSGLGIIVIALAASGGLLVSLVRSLKFVSEVVDSCTSNVVDASSELAKSSGQLSVTSTESAVSITQTSTSLKEIENQISRNTTRSTEANDLSESVLDLAGRGEAQIRNLVHVMSEVQTNSVKIDEVVRLIDDIAFQINFLSLNATVEASRAGEQGKGFAVVADAIRTLANSTTNSAKQISEHVSANHQSTTKGAKLTQASHELMQEVVAGIRRLRELNAEVATASREQRRGLEEISSATSSLDTAIQMNASSATETASVAEELSAQTTELLEAARNLKRLMQGSGPNAGSPRRPNHSTPQHPQHPSREARPDPESNGVLTTRTRHVSGPSSR